MINHLLTFNSFSYWKRKKVTILEHFYQEQNVLLPNSKVNYQLSSNSNNFIFTIYITFWSKNDLCCFLFTGSETLIIVSNGKLLHNLLSYDTTVIIPCFCTRNHQFLLFAISYLSPAVNLKLLFKLMWEPFSRHK